MDSLYLDIEDRLGIQDDSAVLFEEFGGLLLVLCLDLGKLLCK